MCYPRVHLTFQNFPKKEETRFMQQQPQMDFGQFGPPATSYGQQSPYMGVQTGILPPDQGGIPVVDINSLPPGSAPVPVSPDQFYGGMPGVYPDPSMNGIPVGGYDPMMGIPVDDPALMNGLYVPQQPVGYNSHAMSHILVFLALIVAVTLIIYLDIQTDAQALGHQWGGTVLALILVMNVVAHGVTFFDGDASAAEKALTTQALTLGGTQPKNKYVNAIRAMLGASIFFNALTTVVGVVGVPLVFQQVVVKGYLAPTNPQHFVQANPGLIGYALFFLLALAIEVIVPFALIDWLPAFLSHGVGTDSVGKGVRFVVHKICAAGSICAAIGMILLDTGTDGVLFGPVVGTIVGVVMCIFCLAHYHSEFHQVKPAMVRDVELVMNAVFKGVIVIQSLVTVIGLIGIPSGFYDLPFHLGVLFPHMTIPPLLGGWNLFTVPISLFIGFQQYKIIILQLNSGLHYMFAWK